MEIIFRKDARKKNSFNEEACDEEPAILENEAIAAVKAHG